VGPSDADYELLKFKDHQDSLPSISKMGRPYSDFYELSRCWKDGIFFKVLRACGQPDLHMCSSGHCSANSIVQYCPQVAHDHGICTCHSTVRLRFRERLVLHWKNAFAVLPYVMICVSD